MSQAEYDMVAPDFAANDPRTLQTLINDHAVQVHQFPDEIWQSGAVAAGQVLTELRDSGDEMTKKVAESFVSSLAVLRTRTQQIDSPYIQAREKFYEGLK